MAFSNNTVGPVDPGFTTITVTFPFLERSHVTVAVDQVDLSGDAWVWNSDSQIELNEGLVGGETVKVYRTTPAAGVQADFQPGAFDYEQLNESLLHLLYIVQEAYDNASVAVDAGNNAFAYLLQIETLVDEAEVLMADMQALNAAYAAQATAAEASLASELTDALAAISAALTAALGAITSQQTTSVAAVVAAQTTAVNAVNSAKDAALLLTSADVAAADGHRLAAAGSASAAATSAANALTSENNAAASVVGAVKANQVQAFTAAEKIQARANIGAELLGGFRNKLINPLGTINQRSYVSGDSTSGANQYTLDRWRVVISGQNISWTESAGVRTMTAPAGGVEQVIEGNAIVGGSYVLSWVGTATATVNGVARTKGEVFTLTGGTNVTVRFIGGTFSLPQLEAGSTVTSFATRHPQQERALCHRYYWQGSQNVGGGNYANPSGTGYLHFQGSVGGTNYDHTERMLFPVEMRTTPTITRTDLGSTAFPSAAFLTFATPQGCWESRRSTASGNGTFCTAIKADAEL